MKQRKHVWMIIAIIMAVLTWGCDSKEKIKTSIDWSSFLSQHDLVWTRLATKWYEAPFLGNGMMGSMIWQTDDHTVRWDVGRGDVQDHRPGGGMYNTCRLPIGYFMLKTKGKIKKGTMRLHLWDAEATGVIKTTKGSIRWRSIVHAKCDIILAILEPSEGERGCHWEWKTLKAISPRQASGREQPGYKDNPPARVEEDGNTKICIQPLLCGGETATAWTIQQDEDHSLLTVSVAHSFPDTSARQKAVDEINSVRDVSLDNLLSSHRAWWHAYYPESFISIPDKYWESFYWIQMYKLASATRADGMLIDNQGPWLQPTPWPGAWWDLNVELTYWPTNASNRLELGSSLTRTLYSNVENLINTVPEQYRNNSASIAGATGQYCVGTVEAPDGENAPMMGLLLWSLHNCWLHYRYTMDEQALRNDLFPLLKRAVNYYFYFLTADREGKLHLPKTFSPEYKYKKGPDTNFDLALLRWGCKTLVESSKRLNINDPLLPEWKKVLRNLTKYPTDENGFMIAHGVPFAQRHRHYSHLLMIYPLYLVNKDQPGAEEIAIKSVKHWLSFGVKHGYALTGASSMFSAFGKGNEALTYLEGLKEYLQANTFYYEGQYWPVIETPLSGAQNIHDMFIQSWDGTIRVFPAVPDAWGDIVFHDLRTEGAFLVTASRKDRKTQFVRIKSLAGEPCHIIPGLEGRVNVTGSRDFKLKEEKPGVFTLDIKKNEEAILWSGKRMPVLTIAPVPGDSKKCNSFGLKE
ncbi:MAG TPA: alpha-L-fucosidase [Bacteroidetes bacterium]|nr:alpha-L-fucosidase [Bacteroidota bacterium]